ncbi:hypothetical protein ACFL20_11125 [Spirochaetota bacterium]
MKKKRHNPYIIDKISCFYLFVRWHIPYKIISIFVKDHFRIKHYINFYYKYFIGWWLGRFMRSTILKRRPCVRKLKYIGFRDFDLSADEIEELNNEKRYFKLGQVYTSNSFNSATYTIDGYDGCIGCAYFDIVE